MTSNRVQEMKQFLKQKGLVTQTEPGRVSGANIPPSRQAKIDEFVKAQKEAEKDAKKSLFRRFFEELPGAAAQVIAGSPVKLALSSGEGIYTSLKTGGKTNASGKTYNLPLFGQMKSFQSEADDRARSGQGPVKNILQGSFDVGVAGLDTIGLGKGSTKLPGALKKTVNSTTEIVNNVRKGSLKEAIEITRPVLNKAGQESAAAQGRVRTTLFRGKVTTAPTGKDLDIAKASQGLVSKSNTPFKNIANLRREVQRVANTVRAGVESHNGIWSTKILGGKLNDVKLPITVKSDVTLANQAENLKRAVLELAQKSNKKTPGLLDLRQDVDELIQQEFPDLFDDTKTLKPFKEFVLKLRDAINDFTESKLPDGKLPDGSSFRQMMRKQHYLYKAIDNISEKASKLGFTEGSTRISRFTQRHPVLKKLGGVGGAAAAAAVGGGAAYGTVKSILD